MTNEEAILWVKEQQAYWVNKARHGPFERMGNHVKAITLAMKALEQNRWILVSARLPTEQDADKHGRILISNKSRGNGEAICMTLWNTVTKDTYPDAQWHELKDPE